MGSVLALLSLLALPMAGCTHPPNPPRQSREDRVNAAFARDAGAIKQKEGLSSASSAHILVGTAQLADGTQVGLWVSDPAANAGVTSRCWYLDTETPNGAASGGGGCGMPTATVVLDRQGDIVVGSVGTWKAQAVHIETSVATADCQVTGGYFLMPPSLAGNAQSAFTITLLDASTLPIGVVRAVTAPGTATPTG